MDKNFIIDNNQELLFNNMDEVIEYDNLGHIIYHTYTLDQLMNDVEEIVKREFDSSNINNSN